MAQGTAEQRILDGTSWEEFCDTIKSAGQLILAEGSPEDPLDRAEGFRYLSRLTRAALEAFVEYADPQAPTLFRPVHETIKMGADNPDNRYLWAAVDGEASYLLRGKRNTVHYLGFGTYAGFYGGGPRRATGYLEAADLKLEEDGSFVIRVSSEKQEGNWLPMAPDTSQLIVRQTFLDHEAEKEAELELIREGDQVGPSPLTAEKLDAALGQGSRLVLGAASLFASWAKGFEAHTNQLPEFDPEISLQAGGDPNITYYHSYWRLEADEALLIQVEPPRCDHWNFQLNNHWMESLDYRHHRIWVNKHTAALEDDGSVRVIVAHEDPGHPNWIPTVGHRRGTMCWRWVRPAEKVQPACRVVKLARFRSGEVES